MTRNRPPPPTRPRPAAARAHTQPPTASTLEIKAAYRGLMRELHPDLAASFDAEAQEQATTLACLLNDIYDTLGEHACRSGPHEQRLLPQHSSSASPAASDAQAFE